MKIKKYKLFANCKVIKGYYRSVICDLQRLNYYLIPHSLANLFDRNSCFELNFNRFKGEDKIIFKSYFNFLLDNELIFLIEDKEINLFIDIDENWKYPSFISNVIIDEENVKHNYSNIAIDLDKILCYNLQIRIFAKRDFQYLSDLCAIFNSTLLQHLELYVEFNNSLRTNDIINLIKENIKLRKLVFSNAIKDEVVLEPEGYNGGIYNLKSKISSREHCGVVHSSYFVPNISHYTEALNFNTCLNRKISIDTEGNIKNCPSMSQSFGNIRDTTLEEALAHPDFKKYWNVKKDDITKCKDCEFRYICTDCRAYIDDPEDMYSAPLKCGYDPYTGVWEEWSTNPLKQKAIAYYGMEDLIAGDKENNV